MSISFSALINSEVLLAALQERKINNPTPVQEKAIPAILAGKDVLVESPTGTGKTIAYLLPICQKLRTDTKDVQALILAPTHELVMQIHREAELLLEKLGLTAVPLIGGVNPQRQLDKLKTNPAVIVATPGRLKELLEQRKVKIHEVKTVVVDEADRMLDQGFAGPVHDVMKRTLRDTQRLFFSATLPEAILNMVKPMVNEPLVMRAEAPESKQGVLHFYLVDEGRNKVDNLRRLIRLVNAKSTIVFVNTIDKVDEIANKLEYHHLECRLLHRDTSKEERALTLERFRNHQFPVLIATDVAARGIDIPGVECIIHFDPATDADAYIHRSGRTGRMGAAGLVFSLITPQERFIVEKFSKATGIPIVEKAMAFGSLVDPEQKRRGGQGHPPGGKKQNQKSAGTSGNQARRPNEKQAGRPAGKAGRNKYT